MPNYELMLSYVQISIFISILVFGILRFETTLSPDEKFNISLSFLPLVNIFIVLAFVIYFIEYLYRPDNINCLINRILTIRKKIVILSSTEPESAINRLVRMAIIRKTLIGELRAYYISTQRINASNSKWFLMTKFSIYGPNWKPAEVLAKFDIFGYNFILSYHNWNLDEIYPSEMGYEISHPELSGMFDDLDVRQCIRTNAIRNIISQKKYRFYRDYFKTIDELNNLRLEQTYVIIDEFGAPLVVAVCALFHDPLNDYTYTMKIYCYDDKSFVYIPVSAINEIYAFNNSYKYGVVVTDNGELPHQYSITHMKP